MNKNKIAKISASFFSIFGIFILAAQMKITGNIIGMGNNSTNSFFIGTGLLIIGITILYIQNKNELK